MKTFLKQILILSVLGLFFAPASVLMATDVEPDVEPVSEHGSGHSGGCGDLFGDLIHIKRDVETGQPILQKRWIEYPQDLFDWGYCPIAVDLNGDEIPFADFTCDPVDTEAVVEVDYFGRLSGGRTKERVNRMHFDEVINNIKDAGKVKFDVAGRLMFGFDCVVINGNMVCPVWKRVDSPMENMALYVRLMKYGHLQTDPMEIDIWAHGDPAAGVQYHPALSAEDWTKLRKEFLPLIAGGNPDYCFHADGTFNPECALPESLKAVDFARTTSFLAAAADKTGKVTHDLVQYMNRILKITKETETTLANVDLLPALIRDCGENPDAQLPYDECEIIAAVEGLPAPADEKFVDFRRAAYNRDRWCDKTLKVVKPLSPGYWYEMGDVQLLDWLEFVNGPAEEGFIRNIPGFVKATSDSLRTIQFIHNYEIPEDLGWDME